MILVEFIAEENPKTHKYAKFSDSSYATITFSGHIPYLKMGRKVSKKASEPNHVSFYHLKCLKKDTIMLQFSILEKSQRGNIKIAKGLHNFDTFFKIHENVLGKEVMLLPKDHRTQKESKKYAYYTIAVSSPQPMIFDLIPFKNELKYVYPSIDHVYRMTTSKKQAVSFEIPFYHSESIKLNISSDTGASISSRFTVQEKGNYDDPKIYQEESAITSGDEICHAEIKQPENSKDEDVVLRVDVWPTSSDIKTPIDFLWLGGQEISINSNTHYKDVLKKEEQLRFTHSSHYANKYIDVTFKVFSGSIEINAVNEKFARSYYNLKADPSLHTPNDKTYKFFNSLDIEGVTRDFTWFVTAKEENTSFLMYVRKEGYGI